MIPPEQNAAFVAAMEDILELYQKPLSEIPIKRVDKEEQNRFVFVVDQILAIKAKNKDAEIRNLQEKIDQMVYQLYGLTEEEIKVVEGNHDRKAKV